MGAQARNGRHGADFWSFPACSAQAFLAYNKGRGPLSNTNNVRVHIGYDGWWNQIKQVRGLGLGMGMVKVLSHGSWPHPMNMHLPEQVYNLSPMNCPQFTPSSHPSPGSICGLCDLQVYDFSPMSGEDVDKYKLRDGVGGNHSWWGGWVDVPHSGAVSTGREGGEGMHRPCGPVLLLGVLLYKALLQPTTLQCGSCGCGAQKPSSMCTAAAVATLAALGPAACAHQSV